MTEQEALFNRVYQTYGPSLYRFCLMQMKNQADAEDVLQEVFMKRLYRAPDFKTPEHERRWLFQVAQNQCRDEWRRGHRTDLPLEEAVLVSLAPESRELIGEVAALPEKLRATVHLYYYEGYSIREIARILSVTISTVKMRLKRGREALKARLEEEI